MEWRTLRIEFWLRDLLFRQLFTLAFRLSQENVGSTSGLADNEGRVLALTSYTEYLHFWACWGGHSKIHCHSVHNNCQNWVERNRP